MIKCFVKNKKYVLSMSFANYQKGISGMAKVILSHEKLFTEHKISYVYMYLVKKTIIKDKITVFSMYGLIIDGKDCGVYSLSEVLNYFEFMKRKGHILIDVHIHHAIWFDYKHLDQILIATNKVPVKYFIHDYFLLCTNYTLLKNDTIYCGTGCVSKDKCSDCKYLKRSLEKTVKIRNIINNYLERITFIAPSDIAKSIFVNSYSEFINKTIVIPHQILIGEYDGNLEKIGDRKLNIGFLGRCVNHKGGKQWKEIVRKNKFKYNFYMFSNDINNDNNVIHINVSYSKDNLNAMVEALRKECIDVVILWSIWPETYSFTFFEAISANCFVITTDSSGNIADMVKKTNLGYICNNMADLIELFDATDKLIKLVENRKKNSKKGPLILKDNTKILDMVAKEDLGIFRHIYESKIGILLARAVGFLYKYLKR